MTKHNANNERIKRQFFAYLKEAKRQSEDSVDAAAMALDRFEAYTRRRDFKGFHFEQAIAFKRHLAEQKSQGSGKPLSKATLKSTLAHLKRFFFWLADQPGYKSKLNYSDSDYFNLSEKDARVANAQRPQPIPTLEQFHRVLEVMPTETVLHRRDRALVAFMVLTGARDGATTSFKLKHIDMAAGSVFQDARDVRTKFSKTFVTYFFPVGGQALEILEAWITELRAEHLWGNDDPVFPSTRTMVGTSGQWEAAGIQRKHWSSAATIRAIFKSAFEAAGLPYFNPHSVRNTLVRHGQAICRTVEDFKAWSQNLGHEGVLTTLTSYGTVSSDRQAEIFRKFTTGTTPHEMNGPIYEAFIKALQDTGLAPASFAHTVE